MKNDKGAVEKLAMDFRRWGMAAVKRVQRAVLKHGVYFKNWTNDHDNPTKG